MKPWIVRYRLPNGKAVKKGTPGARKVKERSKKWYAAIRDTFDRPKRVPLCADKSAARSMLTQLARKADREQAGDENQFDDHAKWPLAEHIEAFRRHLESKGNTAKHVRITTGRLQTVCEGCGFTRLRDLSASRVADWLAEQRRAGKLTIRDLRSGDGKLRDKTVTFGAKTSNYYLAAVKGFGAWLVRDRRLPENPFAHLTTVNATTDVRRERRTLSADEFTRLVEAARRGEPSEASPGKIGQCSTSWPPIRGFA